MAHTEGRTTDTRREHPLWDEHDACGRHAVLTDILAEVSHEALQCDTQEAVMNAIVECVTRRLPVTMASIILLNEERTHFIEWVWSGRVALALPGGMPWPVTPGASGRCARTGKSQLITDLASDPDYVPGNHGVSSEYLVPIRHRDRLHGVLNLESMRGDFFTPEVCKVFDAVAEQVAGAIHVTRLVRELELANRKLREISMIDGLTGIANRRCFDQRLVEAWDRQAHEGGSLALLMVDVDYFKALNDTSGHQHGDECLRGIARLCSESVRDEGDLVARYGGEEVVVLLPGCEVADAMGVAETLCAAVHACAMPHPQSPVASCVTVSIGVSAIRPSHQLPPGVLISTSDAALYDAKANGRDRVMAHVSDGARERQPDGSPGSLA